MSNQSAEPLQVLAISSGTAPTQNTPSITPQRAQKAIATPLPVFGALMDTSCIPFLQPGHIGLTLLIDEKSSFQRNFSYASKDAGCQTPEATSAAIADVTRSDQ